MTKKIEWTPETEKALWRCCAKGMSDTQIARTLGYSAHAIWRARQRLGIKTKNSSNYKAPVVAKEDDAHWCKRIRAAEKSLPVWVPRGANC